MQRLRRSPFFEDEEGGGDDHCEAYEVVPFEVFAEVGDGEDGEDDECDDLLYGFQLGGGEFVVSDAVGGDLEAVFDEGDEPTDEDDLPEGAGLELQVAVPREGHKDIRHDQQENRPHKYTSLLEHGSRGDRSDNRHIVATPTAHRQ